MKKLSLITMGCSKNTVDSEYLLNLLARAGFTFTGSVEDSDAVIINTCGFIGAAAGESRDMISSVISLKNKGIIGKILVFGCLVQKDLKDLVREMPEVDGFFGVSDYRRILAALGGTYYPDYAGKRTLLGLGHSAYIKISEGCSNRCSFCSIPAIRGPHRSRRESHILREAAELTARGVREINLIGQDTAQYGTDIYSGRQLPRLLKRLSNLKDIGWLRLMYSHPAHITKEMLATIRERDNICSYLDIPVQHISGVILRSMNRKITPDRTGKVIELARNMIPGAAIRTTVIVGYPLETEKEFDELCAFIREYRFERLGAFTYSPEKGTPSHRLGDPISEAEKLRRLDAVMRIQQEISLGHNRRLVGSYAEILIDGTSVLGRTEYYSGRTMAHAPEVDGSVLIKKGRHDLNPGDFRTVRITRVGEYDLFGEIA
jgi:ribosomal protein S12 methylthiotransferase